MLTTNKKTCIAMIYGMDAGFFINSDETAKKAENFLGIWTANIRQCHDIRTPTDGIRGMVEISRHYAENAVDHLSAYEAGKWFIYMKTSDFCCAEC